MVNGASVFNAADFSEWIIKFSVNCKDIMYIHIITLVFFKLLLTKLYPFDGPSPYKLFTPSIKCEEKNWLLFLESIRRRNTIYSVGGWCSLDDIPFRGWRDPFRMSSRVCRFKWREDSAHLVKIPFINFIAKTKPIHAKPCK